MTPIQLLFDARTLGPHYPGVGRYGRGLLGALAALPDVHPTLLADGDGPVALPAMPRIDTSRGPRSPLDQALTPLLLARRGLPAGTVYHSPFYLFPYLAPFPAVVTLYDLTPLHPEAGFGAAARGVYALAHRLAAARARRVIVLAEAARDELAQRLGLARDKVVVISPGHTATELAPDTGQLPRRYIMYTGINKPHKNLPRLVFAYAKIGEKAPPLLIVGPQDPRYPEAQQAVERAGLGARVRFLGRVPEAELARLYTNATLFVFPSLAEGFGFPVLEAMAYGAPVACSGIAVLRELGGAAAAYFDPRSVDDLAACLNDALAAPARLVEMRQRGLERANRYTWQAAAEATAAVYRQALGAGR